ncbi:YciI family protein [Celeribacter sp. PS-C1]|uniref:YciI family protein n=1 Tax=Celeribacter sp. PS-C1 TaxID=2820813 RepID=UPI001C67661B|nr:YciI family protein [Celeribacter sp. PS-C1]MBW6416219.1 YciI family protein [Celeribacter sp. PS-C1]
MKFAVICTDKPGALQIRLDTRAEHVEYLKGCGVVVHAGPFLNDADEMYGSLVIIEVDDMAAAQDWAANDPYAKAGLFSDVRIEAWKQVIGG